jgi:hypothetical protein
VKIHNVKYINSSRKYVRFIPRWGWAYYVEAENDLAEWDCYMVSKLPDEHHFMALLPTKA